MSTFVDVDLGCIRCAAAARLERLELLRRDHAAEASDEARPLAAFAAKHGYTWLQQQAR